MKLFDMFRRNPEAQSRPSEPLERLEPVMQQATSAPAYRAEGQIFQGLDDPAFLEFMRSGSSTMGNQMLRNTAALRCLTLICNGLGMLPLSLYREGNDKQKATDHAAHKLVRIKPNPYQTPMEFKSQMELLLETEGNAYARVIRSGGRPIHLIPFEKGRVTGKLGPGWRMQYQCTTENGGQLTLDQEEILHIRDLSLDGIEGLSRRKLSSEVFDLAAGAQRAASNVFRTGVMAGGAIEVEGELSEPAFKRMKQSMDEDYTGAENANKWMILEDGAKAKQFGSTARDGQNIENRNHQIEEVARLYGVPRPLLMMDDTSWGSGIEQLGIFFVQYTLASRFQSWEEALARTLLTDKERESLYFKFNVRALLRGTLKDQADYFAKALGAGGHQPWHNANEIRDLAEYPADPNPKFNTLGEPTGKKAENEPKTTP